MLYWLSQKSLMIETSAFKQQGLPAFILKHSFDVFCNLKRVMQVTGPNFNKSFNLGLFLILLT